MSAAFSSARFIPRPVCIPTTARHELGIMYSISIFGKLSCTIIAIAPCNHIRALCVLIFPLAFSGNTSSKIILSIPGFYLITSSIESVILWILLIKSEEIAPQNPEYTNFYPSNTATPLILELPSIPIIFIFSPPVYSVA